MGHLHLYVFADRTAERSTTYRYDFFSFSARNGRAFLLRETPKNTIDRMNARKLCKRPIRLPSRERDFTLRGTRRSDGNRRETNDGYSIFLTNPTADKFSLFRYTRAAARANFADYRKARLIPRRSRREGEAKRGRAGQRV